ncbi:MAG: hypothetical protein ACXVBE_08425 [Bdellovibrionota bacterium]
MTYRLIFLIISFSSLCAFAEKEKQYCSQNFSDIINNNSEEAERRISRVVLEEITDNYFNVDRRDPVKIKLWNKALLKELKDLPMTGEDRFRLSGLSHTQIYKLYDRVAYHPVVNYSLVGNYDPKGNIGFCFGRAMGAHLEAIQTGLAHENIRKIWAVGRMRYNNIYWKHHVATIVRDKNGGWWAIDPEYFEPLKLPIWVQKVKKMDDDGKLQFFVTPARRFGPDSNGAYQTTDPSKMTYLKADPYNRYFDNLLEYTREEAAEIKRMRDASEVEN